MADNTEQHRRDCEARQVLKMDNDHRQRYYEGVLKHRGKIKTNELIDDVNKMRRETAKP